MSNTELLDTITMILFDFHKRVQDVPRGKTISASTEAGKIQALLSKQLSEFSERIIGEDEEFAKDITGAPRQVADAVIDNRNFLRSEQRTKLSELLKGYSKGGSDE